MIIDQPLIANLGAASERARPEPQDGSLKILPAVFPHVPLVSAIEPHPGTNLPMLTSFAVSVTLSRVNQASTTGLVAVCTRGLWTINWALSLWTNFAHAGIQVDSNMYLTLGGVNTRVFANLFAANGSNETSGSFRILSRDNFFITLQAGTTGVGQELLTTGSVVAEKHL